MIVEIWFLKKYTINFNYISILLCPPKVPMRTLNMKILLLLIVKLFMVVKIWF